MHFSTIATLIVAASTAAFANPSGLERRDWPKANEYSSPDCSGNINYGHHSPSLSSVNMDPSSHSVYLAGAVWHAYTEINGDGNNEGCHGNNLGVLGGGCVNLDATFGGNRINCVSD